MRDIGIILTGDRIEISDYNSRLIKDEVRKHGSPIRAHITFSLPESSKMRRYVMGCLLPLAVFLDGQEYRDSETCERYFEHYKKEFNPVALKIEGKVELFGQSTKGSKALKSFAEKLQDYISEQHGINYDSKATNPEEYKKWRDELSMLTNDTWIEHCIKMGWLKNI